MYKIDSVFKLKGQDYEWETFIKVLGENEGHCRVEFWDVNKETKLRYHEYESTLSLAAIKNLYEEVKND